PPHAEPEGAAKLGAQDRGRARRWPPSRAWAPRLRPAVELRSATDVLQHLVMVMSLHDRRRAVLREGLEHLGVHGPERLALVARHPDHADRAGAEAHRHAPPAGDAADRLYHLRKGARHAISGKDPRLGCN